MSIVEVVGGVWIALQRRAPDRRGDAILSRLNPLSLFFVSLLPFTTSLMTTDLGDGNEAPPSRSTASTCSSPC